MSKLTEFNLNGPIFIDLSKVSCVWSELAKDPWGRSLEELGPPAFGLYIFADGQVISRMFPTSQEVEKNLKTIVKAVNDKDEKPSK